MKDVLDNMCVIQLSFEADKRNLDVRLHPAHPPSRRKKYSRTPKMYSTKTSTKLLLRKKSAIGRVIALVYMEDV